MHGQMMRESLLISSLLTHAERHHGEQEVVSRRVEGDIHRYNYRALASRARRLANVLDTLSTQPQACIGTLAWNGYRHLELYYAVSGSGRVLHTLDPRLPIDQLCYVLEHAQDTVLFFDLTFLGLVEAVAGRLRCCKVFVAMTDRAHMPATLLGHVLCYEDLLEAQNDTYAWPQFDENQASSLCYTHPAMGKPKGVLYSHRSTVLHSYVAAQPDALGSSASDTILPVVPMFHVNAWGLPYVACMTGAKLVLPGPALDGKSLYELMEAEQVSLSAGVPTVWQGLLAHVETHGLHFSSMRRTLVGGAACPPEMVRAFQTRLGVKVLHAWGMTETSPVGTVCQPKPAQLRLTAGERETVQAKQGRAVFGVDLKIVDGHGQALPWDGRQRGELMVRGPWVLQRYFRDDGVDPLVDGWFPTGDEATLDADGFMQIVGRAKAARPAHSSLWAPAALEKALRAHPGVAQVACVEVRHPLWGVRALLLVVGQPGQALLRQNLVDFLAQRCGVRWEPQNLLLVDALPEPPATKPPRSPRRSARAANAVPVP